MSTLQGERFQVDLQDEVPASENNEPLPALPVSDFVGDIRERAVSDAKLPEPPSLKSEQEGSGFPSHKSRTGASKFKQSRGRSQNESEADAEATRRSSEVSPKSSKKGTLPFEEQQRREIDEENKRLLAEMSPDEIERERQELLSTLDPSLIEKLLKMSTFDDPPSQPNKTMPPPERPKQQPKRPSSHSRKVSFAVPDAEELQKPERPTAKRHSISFSSSTSNASSDAESDYSRSPSRGSKRPSPTHRKVSFAIPDDEGTDADSKQTSERHSFSTETSGPFAAAEDPPVPRKYSLNPLDPSPPPSIHFPRSAQASLDPNSETFLDDLHQKYFPELSHDPSRLEWMKPADPSEDAVYDPSVAAIDPKDIRFSFAGKLIPPSVAHSLPPHLGLHNHGDAPSAAGYTIGELARLARSAYPAQRCLAMQTLGRILYRLGSGEFGREADLGADGRAGERARLARGLWDAVDDGRCTETLTEEANRAQGHRTSIAVAQEAVWLWQRGGGRKRKAV